MLLDSLEGSESEKTEKSRDEKEEKIIIFLKIFCSMVIRVDSMDSLVVL